MSSTSGNSDPYRYPGTNVLKNLRGLTDPDLLERFEARRTHRRIAEMIDTPVAGRFDVAHLKSIHRYINAARFGGRAAWFLGEINAAHPFREGNARTQREFIREVGLQARPLC